LPRIDVNRVTASATYHRRLAREKFLASTVAWGRNDEAGRGTHALLMETSLTQRNRDLWFGRFELAGKEAHDLHADEFGDEVFTVGKLQGGYTRYLATTSGWQVGVGGHLSAGFVPEALKPRYGSRANLGVGLFFTIRPAAMDHAARVSPGADHAHPGAEAASPAEPRAAVPAEARSPAGEPRLPVLEAERVIDPACAATLDPLKAPRASYQGKVYYFCSSADRDAFVRNPAEYLRNRDRR
jgi:YHS domain-containing protein